MKLNLENKVNDSLSPQKSIVFHSTSSQDLYDILVNRKFKAGKGGGAMLGPGFYANQHLEQAQKHNYGNLILQAEISNVDKFFFADFRMYNKFFGKNTKNYAEAVTEQLSAKGVNSIAIKTVIDEAYEKYAFSSSFISSAKTLTNLVYSSYKKTYVYLWEFIKSLDFYGLVYYGDYDKESIVCWRVENVYPIGISADNGVTWTSSKAVTRQLVEGNFETNKEENIKSSNEDQRSYQRAYDLKKRMAGRSDSDIIRAITNQLARITDPLKKRIRTRAFQEVFPDLDLSSIPDSVGTPSGEWVVYYPTHPGDKTLIKEFFLDKDSAKDFASNFGQSAIVQRVSDKSKDELFNEGTPVVINSTGEEGTYYGWDGGNTHIIVVNGSFKRYKASDIVRVKHSRKRSLDNLLLRKTELLNQEQEIFAALEGDPEYVEYSYKYGGVPKDSEYYTEYQSIQRKLRDIDKKIESLQVSDSVNYSNFDKFHDFVFNSLSSDQYMTSSIEDNFEIVGFTFDQIVDKDFYSKAVSYAKKLKLPMTFGTFGVKIFKSPDYITISDVKRSSISDSVRDEVEILTDFIELGYFDSETLLKELDAELSNFVIRDFLKDVSGLYFDDLDVFEQFEEVYKDKMTLFSFCDFTAFDPEMLINELDSWLSKDDIDDLVDRIIRYYDLDMDEE